MISTTDFYKSVFLRALLDKYQQFNVNTFLQETVQISAYTPTEFYNILNLAANDFANSFSVGGSNNQNITPTIGQSIITITLANPQPTNTYMAFISTDSQAGATVLQGGYFISNITTTSFDINLLTPIAATTAFDIYYIVSQ